MDNPYLMDVDPHQPHDPDRTRELVSHLADTVRALNYATRSGSDGLHYPANVYDLLGALRTGLGRLSQTVEQLGAWIDKEIAAGRAVGAPGDDDTVTAHRFNREMADASTHLVTVQACLSNAQITINALRAADNPV